MRLYRVRIERKVVECQNIYTALRAHQTRSVRSFVEERALTTLRPTLNQNAPTNFGRIDSICTPNISYQVPGIPVCPLRIIIYYLVSLVGGFNLHPRPHRLNQNNLNVCGVGGPPAAHTLAIPPRYVISTKLLSLHINTEIPCTPTVRIEENCVVINNIKVQQ